MLKAHPPGSPPVRNYFNRIPPTLSRGWANTLIIITLTISSPLFAASSPLKVNVSAKCALLMNSETGAVLYDKNGKTPWYPASTTKIITALYALERKEAHLDVLIKASKDAVSTVSPSIRRSPTHKHPPYRLEFGGTHMSILPGEELTLRTLLYGLMLASANDAANVIAEYVSGSGSQFIEELNAYVKAQGCLDTTLYTPHGLPHTEHKMTAYDLAKLMRIGLQKPVFRSLIQALNYPRPANSIQQESSLLQHNALIKPGRFYHPKVIGGKTGYTEWGGYTLVVAAEDPHRHLIAVLFGCDTLAARYQDAIALFEAAFKEKKSERILLSKAFEQFKKEVPGGKNLLLATLEEDLILSYYPSEEPSISVKIVWDSPSFPIEPGQKVGSVIGVAQDGKQLLSTSLIATNLVGETFQSKVGSFYRKGTFFLKQHIGILLALGGMCLLSITFYLFHHRHHRKPLKRS